MKDYDDVFKDNGVKIKLGRRKVLTPSVKYAHDVYIEYITSNENITETTGELVVGKEVIAVFSKDGRLWSSDEEEIILDFGV